MPKPRKLDDDEIVYRAVANYKGISGSGELRDGLYLRRLPNPETGAARDVQGVSVALSYEAAVTLCPHRLAVCSIRVGDIRSISADLDVVISHGNHANITGMPYPTGIDLKLALDMAIELLELSTIVEHSLTFKLRRDS